MEKRGFYILIICLMVCMCGCGSQKQEQTATMEELHNTVEDEPNDKDVQEEISEKTEYEEIGFWKEDRDAATVLEDAEFLYFCGGDHILKVNKTTFTEEKIWENAKVTARKDEYLYSGTRGILVSDKIYFIEKWEEETDALSMRALSVVDTCGDNYERIENIPSEKEDRLVLLNGTLYFSVEENGTAMEGYRLSEYGQLNKQERIVTEFPNMPSEYTEVYYQENGSRVLSALESEKRYGYYLLRDEEYELCRVNVATGEKIEFPTALKEYVLTALNDENLLFLDYSNDKLYLADPVTLEYRFLGDTEEYCNVIGMDERYVYYQNELTGDDFCQYQYCRMEIASGQWEELFVIDAFDGTSVSSPWHSMDVSVLDNYIYYVGERDYKLYLMRRDMDMPGAEETLGEAFYDSRISEVGRLESYRETINSKIEPEVVAGSLELEWLVVDETFAGAEKINQQLEAEQIVSTEYLRNNAEDYDEWLDSGIPGFSFSSNVSPIYYMDGRYLSFTQENYDYSGGAHGMPYWIGYTFDLETGNELLLSDIVADDEGTIKESVTRYFTEIYNKNPDEYWDGAVDIVNENTSLQSPFYLSDEGIVFYYGPYELAPYAGGFKEVVVPYYEFDLKIDLQ